MNVYVWVCGYITEKSIPMKRFEPVFVDPQCTGYGDLKRNTKARVTRNV